MASPDESPLLSDALRRAAARLAEVGVTDPSVDTELLAAFVLGSGRGTNTPGPTRSSR